MSDWSGGHQTDQKRGRKEASCKICFFFIENVFVTFFNQIFVFNFERLFFVI